jgi:tetratricopeptide (TPR) repeat protein
MGKFKIGILLLAIPLLYSQTPALRGPEEVLKILENSKIDYQISVLNTVIPDDNSHKPNPFGYYRVPKGEAFEVKKIEKKYNEKALAYFDEAEVLLLTKKDPVKARELYNQALKLEPDLYSAVSGIGETYAAEKNYSEAIIWHKKAIEKNYINEYSHRLLARSYRQKGMLKEAVREITIALVLDRRHQSVIKEWKEIYQAAKLNSTDWTFTPQIRITKTHDNKVLIEYKEPWLSYALAKAAWQYEPGFKEAGGVKANQGYTIIEEFECLYNLTMELAKLKDNEKTPSLKALEEAIWANKIYEYIFFEIIFMKNPFLAYQLPNQDIEKIVDYIIQIRGKAAAQ